MDWDPAIFFSKKKLPWTFVPDSGTLCSTKLGDFSAKQSQQCALSFFIRAILFLSPPVAKHYNRRRFRVEQLALSQPPIILD